MINKRIFLSFLSIVFAFAGVAGATYAVFSDQATSTGNTFSTGNADLQIAEDTGSGPETYLDDLTDVFNAAGLFPGYDEVFRFWLNNNSGAAIDLDLTADVTSLDAVELEDQALADNLLLSWRCDLGGEGDLSDETYTSEFSVQAWFDGGNASLGTLEDGTDMICEMRARILDTVGDEIAGATVDFDVVYDGEQII